jgi:IS30 family transposase
MPRKIFGYKSSYEIEMNHWFFSFV